MEVNKAQRVVAVELKLPLDVTVQKKHTLDKLFIVVNDKSLCVNTIDIYPFEVFTQTSDTGRLF